MKKETNSLKNLNAIAKYAIEHTKYDDSIINRVIDVLNAMRPEETTRATEYLLGIYEEPALSEYSKVYNDNAICELTSYNWLTDEVHYEYKEVIERKFNTKEAADKYAKTGKYNYSDLASNDAEDSIKAKFEYTRESTTDSYYWNKYAIVDEK